LAHAPSDPRQPAESAHRKAAAEAVAESDRENPKDFPRPSQVFEGGRRKQIRNKFRGTAPGPCCKNCERGRGCRYVRNSAPASRARPQHSRKPGTRAEIFTAFRLRPADDSHTQPRRYAIRRCSHSCCRERLPARVGNNRRLLFGRAEPNNSSPPACSLLRSTCFADISCQDLRS